VKKGKGKEVMVDDSQLMDVPVRSDQKVNIPQDDGEAVAYEEAAQFLKIMRQSDYDIVEQLKKTPARISLLSLILTSEPHRQALQKVLNESFVTPDITPQKFGKLVGQVQASNFITFTDDEIDPAGVGHTKALHITVKCKGHIVAKVLIDNGSALNVLPKMILDQLPVDVSSVRSSGMVVRAFDGTKREVIGDLDLDLEIGGFLFKVTFQIMDIHPAYSMLLGRPWIHMAGAIPSSLHQ
jgi:hypothetical protein